jgi:hypothetical protein
VSRWQTLFIGRCSKHGSVQIAVREKREGEPWPTLPIEERFPGESCIRCYLEAHAATSSTKEQP